MDRAEAETSRGLVCPDCAIATDSVDSRPDDHVQSRCSLCGEPVEASHVSESVVSIAGTAPIAGSPPLGGVVLVWRTWLLRLIEQIYWTGTLVGSILLLILGGFVPVARGWLRNDIDAWSDVVTSLGGVWFRVETIDPDSDLGPVLARVDAPLLFSTIDSVGRRLGVAPPGQVRLTYLPCCGVVAWGRSRALIIGLPLFRVLTRGELRSVIAHELAHLARGDATRAARSSRFVEAMEQSLEQEGPRIHGPLGAWARFWYYEAARLIEPVARSQEARADRMAAAVAGGGTSASALVKVAVVQPLFREVLAAYNPSGTTGPNLYAFFRAFWYRLPSELHTTMRLGVLANDSTASDPAHPPLPDRIAALQCYPDHALLNGDAQSATTFLGDLEIFEQMLHNRLFGLPAVEPSVFHRAGS